MSDWAQKIRSGDLRALARAATGVENRDQEALALLQELRAFAGHARMLIGQPDAERLAEEIVAHGLNVRQVESLARENAERGGKAGGAGPARRGAGKNANLVALEKRISDALGLAISIKEAKRGGVLSIRYRNLDQLDDVLRRLEKR